MFAGKEQASAGRVDGGGERGRLTRAQAMIGAARERIVLPAVKQTGFEVAAQRRDRFFEPRDGATREGRAVGAIDARRERPGLPGLELHRIARRAGAEDPPEQGIVGPQHFGESLRRCPARQQMKMDHRHIRERRDQLS